MLRSGFRSLFWAIITERKKRPEGFTLIKLARAISTSKYEVSRWFKGDPNWTVNTIASIASALNVDISIQAIDRDTGAVFTPAGLVQTSVAAQPHAITSAEVRTKAAKDIAAPLRFTHTPPGSTPEVKASVSSMAA
jgi:transcriptional regulator with XRE-family HTH domain